MTTATEWHNYKSSKTQRIAGAYLYLPQITDDNCAHIYQPPGASLWYVTSYVHGVTVEGGPFATIGVAKTETVRQILASLRGNPRQLVLSLPI